LAFLDDDDEIGPDPAEPSRRYGARGERPYLARRLMAIGFFVLFAVLVVLGIRGCLDARKERGFENYVRDLAAITTESQQLSSEFFGRLQDPGDLTELTLEAEIAADRGTAENLLGRVRGLDTPGELVEAQAELDKAFELRSDGIAGIADQIDTALARRGARDAIDQIATYMRYFVASDVLYGRARGMINSELDEQSIVPDDKLKRGTFLPEPSADVDWLDPADLASAFAGVTGTAGGAQCEGVCGVALVDGGVLIGGTALTPGGLANVSGTELEVQVQNQGESEVTDVEVTFSLGGEDGSGTIPRIAVGETESATLNIQPAPASGEELTLDVSVLPVPGEEIEDNNNATFTVVFE